jgi:hypothetical protein
MTFRLPPGELWTETKVHDALVAAWREHPRTPEAAAFMNLVPLLLAKHPEERSALVFRSHSFARQPVATLPERLKAFGLSRSTYEDRWRRGLTILTRELNAIEGRCDNDNQVSTIDARKACAGQPE